MTLTQESRAVDLQIRWAELALESAQLQYDITASELSSGVLTESEQQDFFMEAEEAAKKSKNVVIRAIQKVIEFIKNIAAKIAAAFSEKKVKADVKAIEEVQNDPEVKNAKVEVPDWKDAENNVREYEKAVDDAEKKLKAGKITQEDLDKIKDAKEKCNTKKKIVVGAAATAIALGGTVLAYKKRTDYYIKNLEKQFADANENYLNASTDDEQEDASNMIRKTRIAKDAWSGLKTSDQMVKMSKIDATNARAKLEAIYTAILGACTKKVMTIKSKFNGGKSKSDDASSTETAAD